MKKLVAINILLIMMSSKILLAQSIGFEKTYGDNFSDQAGYSVTQTIDNGYIMVGGNDIFKTDSYGNVEWNRVFVGDGKWVEELSNAYVFCGTRGGNIYVEKRDLSGSLIWNTSYGAASTLNYGYSIRETYDKGFILTGYIDSLNGVRGMYLVKTDSLGAMLWEKVHENDYDERGYSIQETNDNGFIVTGHAEWSNTEMTTIFKLNSTGDSQWQLLFPGSCRDIVQTMDGGYIAVGDKPQTFGLFNDLYILKLDPYGNFQWDAAPLSSYALDEAGNAVVQTIDGGYVISGTQREQVGMTANYLSQAFLLKLDSLSNIVWDTFFGDTQLNATFGYDVDICDDGGFVLLGSQNTNNDPNDFYLVKTNDAGKIEMNFQFDSLLNPTCNGVCNGGLAVAVAGGTMPYTYLWSNGEATTSVSQLCEGQYDLTVTDADGDSITNSYTLILNIPNINITTTDIDESFCGAGDGSISVSGLGGIPPYLYSIDCISYDTVSKFTELTAGTYTLCIMDSIGCQDSTTQIVSCSTGLNKVNDDVVISARPNPTAGMFRVDLGRIYEIVEIRLYTITGAKVITQSFDNHQYINLDLEELIPGIYITKIETPLSVEVIKVLKR